jgi:predicted PolB exonuclease-like 3'-5' exonuclease
MSSWKPVRVDLTNSFFDDYVSFLLDRYISSYSQKQTRWIFEVAEFNPETSGAYYVRFVPSRT